MNDLINAIENGDLDKVKKLLNKDNLEEKSEEGFTPLLHAAYAGKNAIVKFLLSQGANLDAKSVRGSTALQLALISNHTDLAKYLLNHGIKIQNNNDKRSPLHVAVTFCSLDMVKHLVEKYHLPVDGTFNQDNVSNVTALHVASSRGKTEIMDYLIEKGANITNKSSSEHASAFMYVAYAKENQTDAKKLLHKHLLIKLINEAAKNKSLTKNTKDFIKELIDNQLLSTDYKHVITAIFNLYSDERKKILVGFNSLSSLKKDPLAKYFLAICYQHGYGTKVDRKKMLETYLEAFTLFKDSKENNAIDARLKNTCLISCEDHLTLAWLNSYPLELARLYFALASHEPIQESKQSHLSASAMYYHKVHDQAIGQSLSANEALQGLINCINEGKQSYEGAESVISSLIINDENCPMTANWERIEKFITTLAPYYAPAQWLIDKTSYNYDYGLFNALLCRIALGVGSTPLKIEKGDSKAANLAKHILAKVIDSKLTHRFNKIQACILLALESDKPEDRDYMQLARELNKRGNDRDCIKELLIGIVETNLCEQKEKAERLLKLLYPARPSSLMTVAKQPDPEIKPVGGNNSNSLEPPHLSLEIKRSGSNYSDWLESPYRDIYFSPSIEELSILTRRDKSCEEINLIPCNNEEEEVQTLPLTSSDEEFGRVDVLSEDESDNDMETQKQLLLTQLNSKQTKSTNRCKNETEELLANASRLFREMRSVTNDLLRKTEQLELYVRQKQK